MRLWVISDNLDCVVPVLNVTPSIEGPAPDLFVSPVLFILYISQELIVGKLTEREKRIRQKKIF